MDKCPQMIMKEEGNEVCLKTPRPLQHGRLRNVRSGDEDWETGEIMRQRWITKAGKDLKVRPGSGVIEAMNELQRTQWEVNLEFLAVLCTEYSEIWIQD